jgi:competence protein ComGC
MHNSNTKTLIMKTSLTILSLVYFVIACNNTKQPAAINEQGINTATVGVVERYLNAVQHKNVDSMSALLADNYVGYGPSFHDSINKKDAVANWKNLAENLYDSIVFTRSVFLPAKLTDGPYPGDYVSNWSSVSITYKYGAHKGPVNLLMNAVYRVEDGKITLSRTFYDEADAMRQLGFQFIAPTY